MTDGTKNAFATAITTEGSNIYVAGYESTTSARSIAKVWQNGVVNNVFELKNQSINLQDVFIKFN